MPALVPISPLLNHLSDIVRAHALRAGLHHTAAPVHLPIHDAGGASTSTVVWALIGIAVWGALLGLGALSNPRHFGHHV